MVARSRGDEALALKAEQIASRTFELSQLLIDVLGITNAAEQLGSYFPEHVTYHSSCHGMRLLRLGTRQQDLVRTVEGIKYTQIEGMDQCCGFGGTFSFKNPDVSGAMVNDKADNVEATGASICTGGDCSCLMNIGGALSRRGSDVKTIHFAEILASTKENPLKIDRRTSSSQSPKERQDLMTAIQLGMPKVVHYGEGNIFEEIPFPKYAKEELKNEQLRSNLRFVTHAIRNKRARVTAELPDWQELRNTG